MASGIALTIGLNSVDPKQYAGWDGMLSACENDALDMADIAQSRDFEVETLLTSEATRKNVMDGISKAAATLKSGDLFLVTYSGHGGQIPDKNNDEEADAQDETWCLYDAELIDDELAFLWSTFAAGVRIFVLSDSCHSGTVLKAALNQPITTMLASTGERPRYKYLPGDKALQTYRQNKAFYDAILRDPKLAGGDRKVEIKASMILISGCMDEQYSLDGTFNSLFTARLLNVWNEGKYRDSIKAFHQEIKNIMPPYQTPNYYLVGARNQSFEGQPPFSI